MAYEYDSLDVERDDGVAFVTIDHGPLNLFDNDLVDQVDGLSREVKEDDEVKVVVLQSANPDFFICHYDVESILEFPEKAPPKEQELNFFVEIVDRFRTMPKATIGKLAGRVGGGGSEFLLSLDMRFGAKGEAVVNQPEVGLGIIPGGGGTQRLTRLMGRGRALEVILGCDDIPAEVLEQYGYLNRALPPEDLDSFVDDLAYRIASYPSHAIATAKASVAAAEPDPQDGLYEEAHLFWTTLEYDETQKRMETFMEAGGQTPEGERRLGELMLELDE